MSTFSITGFSGVNNMQDPSALDQPKANYYKGELMGGTGTCELVDCVNFDIDDNGGLVHRDHPQEIFTRAYDAKFTQKLRGRTFTVVANKLYYTLPWSDERDPRRSMIAYPALITMIQEVEDGMWVSTTEKIYFHKGHNPTELGGFEQSGEYAFPAIMGTGEKVSANKLLLQRDGFVAIFATTFGICMGDDSGVITNLSEAKFSYVPGQRGVSMIKEANGMIQYMVKFINDIGDSYNQQPTLDLDIDEQ
jgi:hypothetical protein